MLLQIRQAVSACQCAVGHVEHRRSNASRDRECLCMSIYFESRTVNVEAAVLRVFREFRNAWRYGPKADFVPGNTCPRPFSVGSLSPTAPRWRAPDVSRRVRRGFDPEAHVSGSPKFTILRSRFRLRRDTRTAGQPPPPCPVHQRTAATVLPTAWLNFQRRPNL